MTTQSPGDVSLLQICWRLASAGAAEMFHQLSLSVQCSAGLVVRSLDLHPWFVHILLSHTGT